MSPEAQRIKIAEACGWRWESCGHSAWGFWESNGKCAPAVGYTSEATKASLLPDYLSDLNAMNAAEKILFTLAESAEQRGQLSDLNLPQRYLDILHDITCHSKPYRCNAFAAASQRAEAFLRTLNLFTE